MKIKNDPTTYKARIVIQHQSTNKNKLVQPVKYIKNTKPKQGLLTKIMTCIIKPILKCVLKTPS